MSLSVLFFLITLHVHIAGELLDLSFPNMTGIVSSEPLRIRSENGETEA